MSESLATLASSYRDQPVTVVGGMGFIGSTLARALVHGGARVSIVDSMHPQHGGNPFNIADVADRLDIHIGDASDVSVMSTLVRDSTTVFNLAGQVSHVDSMTDPAGDLASNCASVLGVLEALRRAGSAAFVVYTSTRQVYGRAGEGPIDESHPLQPIDINGIHKVAAEEYHRLYAEMYGQPSAVLRLTNTYGPRQLIRHARQGFVPWFVRLALLDQEIQLYAPGSQTRDFCYVDDAVDALLRAGLRRQPGVEVFNIGGSESATLKNFTERLIEVAGRGTMRLVEYPPERKRIEIGNIAVCDRRFRDATGWRPTVNLNEGLTRMIAYYRAHGQHYLEACG